MTNTTTLYTVTAPWSARHLVLHPHIDEIQELCLSCAEEWIDHGYNVEPVAGATPDELTEDCDGCEAQHADETVIANAHRHHNRADHSTDAGTDHTATARAL